MAGFFSAPANNELANPDPGFAALGYYPSAQIFGAPAGASTSPINFSVFGSGNTTGTSGVSPLGEKAVLNPTTGMWVSPSTGAAWTGAITNPDGTISHTQNGKKLPEDQYGNPLPNFTPITTVKQPDIAAAGSGLLATANANAAQTNSSFNNYLQQANALNAQGAQQLQVDQAAVDPTATINRLNTDTANTTATVNKDVAGEDTALNSENNQYATDQNKVQGDVATENTAAAATTASRIAQLSKDLTAENNNYETASQAVANQAYDQAGKAISLYQLGTGTPTSASGNLSNRYIKAYDAVNIPLQQDLANRSLATTNQIYGDQSQADQQAYQNLINQYAGRAALNADLTNRATGNTQYQGSLGTSTAEYTGNLDAATAAQVQQLKNATAGMSRAMAAQYLQQLQIPLAVGQQVLGAEAQTVAQIQSLDNGANYYTLSSPYTGNNVPGAPAVNTTAPGNRYQPTAPNTNPLAPNTNPLVPALPNSSTVPVNAQQYLDANGNTYYYNAQGQRITIPAPAAPVPAGNSYWNDPANDGSYDDGSGNG